MKLIFFVTQNCIGTKAKSEVEQLCSRIIPKLLWKNRFDFWNRSQ